MVDNMNRNIKEYRIKLFLSFAVVMMFLILGIEGLSDLNLIFKGAKTGIIGKVLTGGIIPTITILVVENIINSKNKANIVLLGRKLPGFNLRKIIEMDYVLTEEKLINCFGEIPNSGKEQNNLWYCIYKNVQNKDKVFQAQKEFLILRDLTYLMLVGTIFGGVSSFFLPVSKLIWLGLIIYLILSQATYNKACRFSAIVLNEGII